MLFVRQLALLAMSFAIIAMFGCKSFTSSQGIESGVLDATGGGEATYTGHSDYRLVFVNRQKPDDFDPSQDLLKPSTVERVHGQLLEAMQSASLKSLIPMMGFVSGNRTGTEENLFGPLLMMASQMQQTLQQELDGLINQDPSVYPLVHEVMLIPWDEGRNDIFYSADKISMHSSKLVNVLGTTPSSPKFPEKLTDNIKKLQKKLYESSDDPVNLLAMRGFLFMAPGNSRLTLRFLLGLKPMTSDFTQEDDRVKFNKVVIPDVPGRGGVASLEVGINLADPNENPTLTMTFGDFDRYNKGAFTVVEGTQQTTAPRLQGSANKTGTTWVELDFSFKKLTLDLRTVQLSSLDTLLSPGIKVGGTRWTTGAFQIESVDQGFQTEINNTIDGAIEDAMESANEKILGGIMTKDIMTAAFEKILGRG